MDWLGQFALGIATAAAASWITVQLSLRRFYQEKWWEKKYEAYVSLIETLHELNYAMLVERVKVQTPEHAEKHAPLTQQFLNQQMKKIGKAIDFGELLVSPKMIVFLRKFANDLGDAGKLGPGALPASIKIMGETLPIAVDLARRDLALSPWRWPWVRSIPY